MTLFDAAAPAPRLFAAPAGRPFAEALADGVLERLVAAGGGPLDLADIEIYLTTRRAQRAVSSAFIRASERVFGARAALGPRLRGLAELGTEIGDGAALEAPPAIDPLRRLLLLTRLVRQLLDAEPTLGAPAVAAPLAADLARLLDAAHGAGAALEGLDAFGADAGHAAHWALSAKFLSLLRDVWPALLAAEGAIDPEDRRRRLVGAIETQWRAAPPRRTILAAGSPTDATAAWFLSLIAQLPQGAVILPGLDTEMDAVAAAALRETATPEHPQAAFFELMARFETPQEVADWAEPPAPPARARLRLLGQTLRPAPVTDAWRDFAEALSADAPQATAPLTLIEAPGPREEALAIALAMREATETPGRRAALVTPDRVLARRVAAELARWGIEPDDSGGRPLALTAPGVFLRLTLDAALSGFAPAATLAMVKHPLATVGVDRGRHLRAARWIERWALRGARPAPGLDGLRAAVAAAMERRGAAPLASDADTAQTADDMSADDGALDPLDWIDAVADGLMPLAEAAAAEEAPLETLIAAHRRALETLSRRPEQERPEVFEKPAGEALAAFLDDFAAAADAHGPIAPAGYPGLLAQALQGRAVREAYGRHPRVMILGPLEARMQSADLVCLGGLNEGVWPQIPAPDPWLSRGMRASLGLPPLEARIGLSANDFFQAAMAPNAIFSRSERADGAPTVPSRWLMRLTTLLGGAAPDALREMRARGAARLALADVVDAPAGPATPAPRPKPTPPLEARPRRLSVTEVETLIRDPYAIYAKHALRLAPLPELEETPDARDRGRLLHDLAEQVVQESLKPGAPPLGELYDRIAEDLLAPMAPWPGLQALWRARIETLRDWFLESEAERRAEGAPIALEAPGSLAFEIALGPALLTARADRIDRLADGAYAIYDYKTGAPPTEKQVDVFAKQLPLEAAILSLAGFAGAPPGPVSRLGFLRLWGGRRGGEARILSEAPSALGAEAFDGLVRLLNGYSSADAPFSARARPEYLGHIGDYDHLARYGEWGDGA